MLTVESGQWISVMSTSKNLDHLNGIYAVGPSDYIYLIGKEFTLIDRLGNMFNYSVNKQSLNGFFFYSNETKVSLLTKEQAIHKLDSENITIIKKTMECLIQKPKDKCIMSSLFAI